jgi:hypothetical protein
MSGTQSGFFENLISAVRENPLAAVLIGGGAFWLLAGNDKLRSAASSATAAVPPIADIGGRNVRAAASKVKRTAAPPTAPEMDHDESFRVGETLREAGSAASDAVSGAATKVGDRFEEGAAFARERLGNLSSPLPGKETLTKAVAEVLERQPLVLGGVGLAIGAAIAGAFRASDLENEWVGEFSDGVKGELNTRAGAVSQSLREASDTLKAELSEMAAEAVDRVKLAGTDAADAAWTKVKSP